MTYGHVNQDYIIYIGKNSKRQVTSVYSYKGSLMHIIIPKNTIGIIEESTSRYLYDKFTVKSSQLRYPTDIELPDIITIKIKKGYLNIIDSLMCSCKQTNFLEILEEEMECPKCGDLCIDGSIIKNTVEDTISRPNSFAEIEEEPIPTPRVRVNTEPAGNTYVQRPNINITDEELDTYIQSIFPTDSSSPTTLYVGTAASEISYV